MTSHTYRIIIIPFDGGKRPSLPISSRQIDESISIADFFPPNCRVDFFPPNCRFCCRFLPAKYIIVLRTTILPISDFSHQSTPTPTPTSTSTSTSLHLHLLRNHGAILAAVGATGILCINYSSMQSCTFVRCVCSAASSTHLGDTLAVGTPDN